MQAKQYTSNLTQDEYDTICPYLPIPKTNKLFYEWRSIINGIFYVEKNGCTWRDIPIDLPPWETCYYHFKRLRKSGFWENLKIRLNKQVRIIIEERNETPSCLLLDTQSVKNTDTGCSCGIDGNKKIKGIKKSLLNDTLGLNWGRTVVPANTGDRECGYVTIQDTIKRVPRCKLIKADEGYSGIPFGLECLKEYGITIEIVEKLPDQIGFQVLPLRWVTERSNAWMDKCRRMWKNCERLTESAEAMIDICFLRIAMKRLAKSRGGTVKVEC
jgi:putative transposase